MITQPGIYEISEDDYHADNFLPEPSLSSSIAKLLVTRTPRHAWERHPRLNVDFEPNYAEQFDIGKAAHSLMLRDPKNFEIIDAPNWKTKDAQGLRDLARKAGRIPLLKIQWERVQAMTLAASVQLEEHPDARNVFTRGRPERTLCWLEGTTWCRARLDWLPDVGPYLDDYKSCDSADPDAFKRAVIAYGYDIQASFYMRGVKALGIFKRPEFRFIAQETTPPYALSVIALAPGFLDLADRKVERAIKLWQQCLKSGEWPSYPSRTCYLDVPDWHEAAYLNREWALDHDPDQLSDAAEAQAPL